MSKIACKVTGAVLAVVLCATACTTADEPRAPSGEARVEPAAAAASTPAQQATDGEVLDEAAAPDGEVAVEAVSCDLPAIVAATADFQDPVALSCAAGTMSGVDARDRYRGASIESVGVCAGFGQAFGTADLGNEDRRDASALLTRYYQQSLSSNPAPESTTADASNALGLMLAADFQGRYPELDPDSFCSSFRNAFDNSILTTDDSSAAGDFIATYHSKRQQRRTAEAEMAGAVFLESNRERPGVIETDSGLHYRATVSADGAADERPTIGDTVEVRYEGRLVDGATFLPATGEARRITLGDAGLPAGLTEGIALMTPGTHAQLVIPPYLGYGEIWFDEIVPPGSVLVFDVELVSVLKSAPLPAATVTPSPTPSPTPDTPPIPEPAKNATNASDPGQLLVKFVPGVSTEAAAMILDEYGGDIVSRIPGIEVFEVRVNDDANVERIIELLSAHADVDYAEPNGGGSGG